MKAVRSAVSHTQSGPGSVGLEWQEKKLLNTTSVRPTVYWPKTGQFKRLRVTMCRMSDGRLNTDEASQSLRTLTASDRRFSDGLKDGPESFRGSVEPVGFILWGPRTAVKQYIHVHQIAVGIFFRWN